MKTCHSPAQLKSLVSVAAAVFMVAACGQTPTSTAAAPPTPPSNHSASPVAAALPSPSPGSGKAVTITTYDGYKFTISASAPSLVASEPWLSQFAPPGQNWLTTQVTVTNLQSDRPLPLRSIDFYGQATVAYFYIPQADASSFGKVCTGPPFNLDCVSGPVGSVAAICPTSSYDETGSYVPEIPAGDCGLRSWPGDSAFYVDRASQVTSLPQPLPTGLHELVGSAISPNGVLKATVVFGPVLQGANLSSLVLSYEAQIPVTPGGNPTWQSVPIPLG